MFGGWDFLVALELYFNSWTVMVISGCGPAVIRPRYLYGVTSSPAHKTWSPMSNFLLRYSLFLQCYITNCQCLHEVGPCTFKFKFLIHGVRQITKYLNLFNVFIWNWARRPQLGSTQLSTRHIGAEYIVWLTIQFWVDLIYLWPNSPRLHNTPLPLFSFSATYQILGELYSSIQARLMSFDTTLRPARRSNKDFMVFWVKLCYSTSFRVLNSRLFKTKLGLSIYLF